MPELDPIDVHIGGVLRRMRKNCGWSLERLAAEIGVTYQQVQKYETGSNRISAATLYRIAVVLNLPLASFFPSAADDAAIETALRAEDLKLSRTLARIADARIRSRLNALIASLEKPSSARQ